MSKSVVIVTSSMRAGGNSDTLANEFARGAQDAGHKVEIIALRNLKYQFCKGCLACQKLKHCVLDDDANRVMSTVQNADVVVFATPIYYYSVCGQLKTFLDRMNPIFAAGHRYKTVWLLASAADENKSAFDGAIKDIQGWIDCFDGVMLAGVVCGAGLEAPCDIQQHPEYMKEAYIAGNKNA